jgi:hypothetical protein
MPLPKLSLTGHWFCTCCKAVVLRPPPAGRWDLRASAVCPQCRNHSCRWVCRVPSLRGRVPTAQVAAFFPGPAASN